MGKERALTKSQYAKLRHKAKKMGFNISTSIYGYNRAEFKWLWVMFEFKPLEWYASMCERRFFNKEEADEIKKTIDLSMDFVEFLKKFNEDEVETKK